MRAVAFFVQLLLVLLIIRIVLRGIAGLFVRRPAAPRSRAPRAPAPRQIEDLVLDRVCHTHFPRSSAVQRAYRRSGGAVLLDRLPRQGARRGGASVLSV